jgi:hypothetical protein
MDVRQLESIVPSLQEPDFGPDETKRWLPSAIQSKLDHLADSEPFETYIITLIGRPDEDSTELVATFSSDVDACAAARRLMRHGQHATITAGARLVGQVSLAHVSPQIEASSPSTQQAQIDSGCERLDLKPQTGFAPWMERWLRRA